MNNSLIIIGTFFLINILIIGAPSQINAYPLGDNSKLSIDTLNQLLDLQVEVAIKVIAVAIKVIAVAIKVIAVAIKVIAVAIKVIAVAIKVIAVAIKVIAVAIKVIAVAIKVIAVAIKVIAVAIKVVSPPMMAAKTISKIVLQTSLVIQA